MRSFDSTLQDDVQKSEEIGDLVQKNQESPQKFVTSSPNKTDVARTNKSPPIKEILPKVTPNFGNVTSLPKTEETRKNISIFSPVMKSSPKNIMSPPPNVKSATPYVTASVKQDNVSYTKVSTNDSPKPNIMSPKEISPQNSINIQSFRESLHSEERELSKDSDKKTSIESGAIKSVKDIAKQVESMGQKLKENGNEHKASSQSLKSTPSIETPTPQTEAKSFKSEDSNEGNGVGNKIKQFEKVVEGLSSRPESIRRKSRLDQGDKDIRQPQTKMELLQKQEPEIDVKPLKTCDSAKWRKDSLEYYQAESAKIKPDQPKTIRQDQKFPPTERNILSPPSTVRSIQEHFSQSAFVRNNPSPIDALNQELHFQTKLDNTQTMCKSNKIKKEKHCHKSNAYFTRGSEEIWLVKKKDIEEIEDRVLESFRRAGGNPEAFRVNTETQASFSHTLGRNKRPVYARSESLDPQWANARAQTLKRQSSVACTCGHDKKTRPKSGNGSEPPRPRSRSHGDENSQTHVLDKYETLV